MSRLHVAILDEEFPYPLTSGKRIRTFNLLTRLAKRHRVTYIAHQNADSAELREAVTVLRNHGIHVIPVEYRVPPKAGVRFYGRLMGNLLSPLPYSVATHASRAMQRAMDRLAAQDPPDLWHCEWTPYAQAMYRRPGRWVVMAHNVESVIWRRYAEAESNPLKRWFLREQHRKFEHFERWAYNAATRSIAVSHEDAERIELQFGVGWVDVVENGVDTAFFTPNDTIPGDPARILFLGSLDWRPNLDAVRLLLDDIFPRVRAAEPRASLDIVGRKPPESLRAELANREAVRLHADVPNVRLFLRRAGVLAVPLRIGGGSRLKILEALATGLPVVTTTVGAEGLRLTPGQHCTVADGPEPFAAALRNAISNPAAARDQAAAGRARVLREYDWAGLADRLDQVWRAAAAAPSPVVPEIVAFRSVKGRPFAERKATI